MGKEKVVHCLLGNGICPEECPNHDLAVEVSKKLGEDFDPFFLRLNIVMGDGRFKDINLTPVSKIISRCIEEKQLKSK